MPPRRSAKLAKRAAADVTDDAKRHKVNGASMAAAAVSAPAAASSSNSSSAGAAAAAASSSSSQRSDADLAAAIPLPESLDCPTCFESFPAAECKEEGGAGRVPRSLFCSPKPHTYCTDCLEQMPPASAAAAAAGAAASEPTDAELVRLIPINASLMESIRRGQQLERMVRETQQQLQGHGGTTPCTYPHCDQPALFWCDECDSELCAAHDRDLHEAVAAAASSSSSSASHRRTPLSERAAARQARMAARLASNGAKLRASASDFEKEAAHRVSVITGQLEAEVARHQREVLELQAHLAAEKSVHAASIALVAKVAQLSDAELLKYGPCILPLIDTPAPPDGLLATLSAERRSHLERFLQAAGVSLDQIRGLLYHGSRDGFRPADFVRMCAGHGATLTLIKVKGNGFIFGAYTHCKWPSVNGVVADPTGKSFLFSLVNRTGRAVRYSLRDQDRAIHVANSISIGASKYEGGKATGHSNIILMRQGQAADRNNANCANPPKNDNSFGSYQADDAAVYAGDSTFLAGQQHFATEQIEVYKL